VVASSKGAKSSIQPPRSAAYLAKPFMEEILCAAIEAALTNGYEGLWTTVEAAKHQSPSP
jgi:hypothetical protein